MSSKTISCRILGCLLLALLSQYADARKPHYLESILTSLQRLENMLIKQAEQNSLNCYVPAEKLFNLLSEHQTSSNESNETSKSNGQNSLILRALDLHNDIQQFSVPKKHKHRRKSRNHNENINANINENVNANINANRHHRRSFDDVDSYLSKAHNQNMNSNFNLNSNLNKNRDDMYDFSDEDEI